MDVQKDDKIQEIAVKYKKILGQSLSKEKEKEEELIRKEDDKISSIKSKEFEEFRQEYLPQHLNIYEKCCNYSEKILKIKPDSKKEESLKKSIEICHLN